MRLEGRTALITGAGSGIGAATALLFAREGARLLLSGRREAPLFAVANQVKALGGQATVRICDVTKEDDCEQAVAEAESTFGGLDILFNNAGIIYREKPAHMTSLEEWELTFAVNTRGTFLMSKAALSVMRRQGSGAIVNNASCVGLAGGEGIAAYSASKGAVVLLTRSMALDHAREGIRVNCVCPGAVDTPMLDREMEEMGGADLIRESFEKKHPLGRIGASEEVAHAVLYLSSAEASFVTGVALPVDGGRLA